MSFSSTNKYNYIEIVNRAVPEYYRETDYALFGSEEDVSLSFLGKLLKAAIQNDQFFDVSTLDRDTLAQYFVPQGKTRVSPNSFQSKFLSVYDLTLDSFKSDNDLKEWLSGTFFPDTKLNDPSGFHYYLSSHGFGAYNDLSATHKYLIENLGMFYFMNTSSLLSLNGNTADDASSIACELLGVPLTTGAIAGDREVINALFKFFYQSKDSKAYYKSFFPHTHASGVSALSSNEYLSGTQMFDTIKLQLGTWTDPRLRNDSFFKDSLDALLVSNQAPFPVKLRDAGPFQRFLKAVSLGIADAHLIVEELGHLLSIDECPDKFLELLANNIGWRFVTGDYSKWRAQLANAVLMYKTKGSVVGLRAVCRLIFPDGIFTAEDLKESWESYLPKLLYYLVKTESFVAKERLEFGSPEVVFDNSWPSNVRFNQASPNYEAAADRNYRFLVDGILEHFHNQYSGIVINGQDFKNLPMWTCLPVQSEVNSPQLIDAIGQKGFYHRNYPSDPTGRNGFLVAVPPWEKYGFYKECELSHDKIEFFCNVLSGSRDEFGFEVPTAHVEVFKSLLKTAIDELYQLSGTPTLAGNNKFRVFTSGHELPPNYSAFVEYGHASSLNDFDTWNTKGSFVFAAFAASTIDYTIDGYDTFKNKAALQTYHDVLKDFLPLHAVIRLLLYVDFEDTHEPIETLCLFTDKCLETFNTEYLRSYRTNFWAGASGLGVLGATTVNGDGRVLPSYLSAQNDWWQVSATDLDRNASRRRDYRYALKCYPYMRGGFGQPIALNHYGIATQAAPVSEDPYVNTWEYISKGFNYDTQTYDPPSSVVWDNSGFYDASSGCALTGLSSGNFELSSLYPSRAVPETDFLCSSLNVYRDSMKGVMEVMTSRGIKENKFFDFSDANYRAFQLGTSLHKAYSIYTNEFSSILEDNSVTTHHYYGGYNFISYAFGPTIWNSNFYHRGTIATSVAGLVPSPVGFPFANYEPDWKYIVGGTSVGSVSSYYNYKGATIQCPSRSYFAAATDTTTDPQIGVHRSSNHSWTKEILSGIEIHQPYRDSESFVVCNDNFLSGTKNAKVKNSVTMFNVDGRPLKLEVPFNPADLGSTYFNKLRPQSQFAVDVFARTQNMKKNAAISLELVTSGVLDNEGVEVEWRYSWITGEWKRQSYSYNESEFIKTLTVDKDEHCVLPYRADFHTQDKFTIKGLPCNPPFKTGDVHTVNTGYVLKVSNSTISPRVNRTASDGLTIFEISVVDMELNRSMNDFNATEVDIIYTFWDGLAQGIYSRNSTLSTAAFETSGGSRAEYVELLGGDAYTSTVAGPGSAYTATVFEVGD